jgi:hypothetical protein
MFFDHEVFPTLDLHINQLHEYSKIICGDYAGDGVCGRDYILVLVKPNTFPPTSFTGPGKPENKNSVFKHWTIVPDLLTDSTMIRRMEGLMNDINHSCQERLAKFMTSQFREDMMIIQKIIDLRGTDASLDHPKYDLQRPEYWRSTLIWILDIQAKFSKNFDKMTSIEKDELYVFAMASGSASLDGSVHYNYKTSANFLDFSLMTSEYAVAREMDKRSDPRTNQVSQVAFAKAANGVSSKFNISMIWDGKKHRDDLDLKCEWLNERFERQIVYFGTKEIYTRDHRILLAKLDFDAGISGKEDNPCENISFSEAVIGSPIQVYVNNYTRRTLGDVHFTIVITQPDQEDKVIHGVWPKDRERNNHLHVTTHIFTPVVEAKVFLSETQAHAAEAQNKEFNYMFGKPTSKIATVANLIEHRISVLMVPKIRCDIIPDASEDKGAEALLEFDRLVIAGLQSKPEHKTNKVHLSDRMRYRPPTTFAELCQAIKDGKIFDLAIHPPDQTPGFVTLAEVETNEVFMSGEKTDLTLYNYPEKFKQPLPSNASSGLGTARLDSSWGPTRIDGKVSVIAVADFNGKNFLVLDGARLSNDVSSFPMCAGFCPQHLSAKAYKHRSKWAFLNVSVTPQMQTSDSPLAIGALLTGETATVFVNGAKLVLRV